MAEPIIVTQGLTKRYKDLTAVDDLTLTVDRGEVFGLLGPNGAGKTTTILMLLGLSEPTSGRAMIAGRDCTREPLEVKRIVGYLADDMGFYPDMTGRENLRLTGRINGIEPKQLEERIDELLERVGMTAAADKRTGTYSKGMKQRLGIADILIKDPEVLIMDEPTNGIDPEGIRELMALIRELADRDGKTILVSSHQLHQMRQVCDRVGIFVHGRLVVCGTIDELARRLEQQKGISYSLIAEPADEGLTELLLGIDGVRRVQENESDLSVCCDRELSSMLADTVVRGGYALKQLARIGSDLDDIYSTYFLKAGEDDAERTADKKRGGLGRRKD